MSITQLPQYWNIKLKLWKFSKDMPKAFKRLEKLFDELWSEFHMDYSKSYSCSSKFNLDKTLYLPFIERGFGKLLVNLLEKVVNVRSFSCSTISLGVKNYQIDALFWTTKFHIKSQKSLGTKKSKQMWRVLLKLNSKWNELSSDPRDQDSAKSSSCTYNTILKPRKKTSKAR